jgi:hypothetical protein
MRYAPMLSRFAGGMPKRGEKLHAQRMEGRRGNGAAIPWHGARLVIAIALFAALLLGSLFLLRTCRDTQPRPRIFPWTVHPR